VTETDGTCNAPGPEGCSQSGPVRIDLIEEFENQLVLRDILHDGSPMGEADGSAPIYHEKRRHAPQFEQVANLNRLNSCP
jgi:hypothetical protein